ncbi:SAM-dependent DNA methyltransferase [Clostridium sp. YIM B02505]|uniref:site-specific DNA-methyltransferase (adenine-specific) n=1 Tax=Clostridium yunnanense TaxID=2800325 RepID=A0ABS1EQD5_9CLOT|nr:class I SAM-dependent DNA methyltransferase [Clostridium yunnanense]MBK1811555.1 SAM-dependent DNA methyltransferase [Clostridium yunnanense]
MAVKKTELYSSLWASCDELRGGMDASQYKDYILTLLFIKYVTDKYKGQKYADIKVFDKENDPESDSKKRTGCSFDDFIALKNSNNIGEGMDKIIARLADVNPRLKGVIDNAHFNDESKIGKGKEMVDKLSNLISIFQRPELNFKNNNAEGDDIIGDAYEYLMRNFATESGKSKGQFYTPAEVSRILAKVIGIDKCDNRDAEVCDPACGSGSLLIRALEEVPFEIAGYGQEKEGTTAGLAMMNAVLHNKAAVVVKSGNTFSDPQYFKDNDETELRRFDYIVANPPFSTKNWTNGIKEYGRFEGYGDRPPETNGDYAWLLHILKTLKSNGKAAVILPHGVLFRGNAEATIRKTIIDKGFIKGIISLPANLFYGTGIPACILIIDKEDAANRQGIFMIDASKDFIKDGNKNRLRERDVYKIVTTFNNQIETNPKYSRFVPMIEIKEKNEYNLNISRYIDTSEAEDLQNIKAHIHGGIPALDVDSLDRYWAEFLNLKDTLFTEYDEGFYKLNISKDRIRQTIYSNDEFAIYGRKVDAAFESWKNYANELLLSLNTETSPKQLIFNLAEKILVQFEALNLIDKYDVYQVLLGYWLEVMGDDVFLIINDSKGYSLARETESIIGKFTSGKKKGQEKVIGWDGKLIPKTVMIDAFFPTEKATIQDAENVLAETDGRLTEIIENTKEDSILNDISSDDGKVKIKDIESEIEKIHSHIKTEESIELEVLLSLFPMKKNEYVAYVSSHQLCKNAYTDKGTITKASITERLQKIRSTGQMPEIYLNDYEELKAAYELSIKADEFSKLIKELKVQLDEKCKERYSTLTDEEIKDLLINRKWYYSIGNGIESLYSAISHRIANRVTELAERYEQTLPQLSKEVSILEDKVKIHLERMGFVW